MAASFGIVSLQEIKKMINSPSNKVAGVGFMGLSFGIRTRTDFQKIFIKT